MEDRRTFLKNGLTACLGAGGVLWTRKASGTPPRPGVPWGMFVDASRCTGCNSCTVACKLQSNTEPMKFNTQVEETEQGRYPHASNRFMPRLCRHCAKAPCAGACPTGATAVSPAGIVNTDWNLCEGCGACVAACPYEVRFHDSRFGGRVDKCDLCAHRLEQGLQPACVENCASGARIFGRFDAPEGEFAVYLKKAGQGRGANRASAVIFYPGTQKDRS